MKYIKNHLKNPKKFNCTGFLGFGCSEEKETGRILDPILTNIIFDAAADPQISSEDKQTLRDAVYGIYKDHSLSTDPLAWQLAPGVLIQFGAWLDDPRAFQKAVEMMESYLKGPNHGTRATGNFQSAMFALQSFYKRQKSDANSPLTQKSAELLRQTLNSDFVPEFVKAKLKESLNESSIDLPSSPKEAADGTR